MLFTSMFLEVVMSESADEGSRECRYRLLCAKRQKKRQYEC